MEIYLILLAAMLGFQSGALVMWRWYRRQVDFLRRDLRWERGDRA